MRKLMLTALAFAVGLPWAFAGGDCRKGVTILFHNHFTGGTVTEVLSPQEFYLAQQLRDGRSYEEIADKLNVSRSRVNRVVESIYAKLGVHGKAHLGDYVW